MIVTPKWIAETERSKNLIVSDKTWSEEGGVNHELPMLKLSLLNPWTRLKIRPKFRHFHCEIFTHFVLSRKCHELVSTDSFPSRMCFYAKFSWDFQMLPGFSAQFWLHILKQYLSGDYLKAKPLPAAPSHWNFILTGSSQPKRSQPFLV